MAKVMSQELFAALGEFARLEGGPLATTVGIITVEDHSEEDAAKSMLLLRTVRVIWPDHFPVSLRAELLKNLVDNAEIVSGPTWGG